jgi:hypothetical protein
MMTSKSDETPEISSVHPKLSSVESTSLKERKTDYRNGITIERLSWEVDTMSRRLGRMPSMAGLPKKQMPGVMPWIR